MSKLFTDVGKLDLGVYTRAVSVNAQAFEAFRSVFGNIHIPSANFDSNFFRNEKNFRVQAAQKIALAFQKCLNTNTAFER